ncbi:MAG: hypothetical protein IJU44_04290 [Kiritimatiellae bacterium]|nr:hypothetical protein [Kiritimatiellia bacterium]
MMKRVRCELIFWSAAIAMTAFGGLREDFTRIPPTVGVRAAERVRAVHAARCAVLIPEGLSALKPYAGSESLTGVSLAEMPPIDAGAFAVAQTERNGFRVFAFSERSGRYDRELVVKPGEGLAADDAEVWDPQQGIFEKPFADKGNIRLTFAPNETLFLVWPPEPRPVLPPRMEEIVGPEIPIRVSVRETTPVDGGAALEGAAWIWHPGAKTAKGFATLRTVFDLPNGMQLDSAVLTFSCDNGAVVRLNGKEIAKQSNQSASWQRLSVQKDVRESLKSGRNVLEAVGENIIEGDAGLIASLDMVVDGKPMRVFTNDSTWEASLDGQTFVKAWAAGKYGDRPWLRFDETGYARQAPLTARKETVIAFSLGTVKPAGRLFFVCDAIEGDRYALLEMNGSFIGGFASKPYRMDLTPFVKESWNTLRIPSVKILRPRLVQTAPAKGPYDLRCEYQTEPLGVVKPRFFWKYAGAKPEKFTLTVAPVSHPEISSIRTGFCETKEHLYVEPKWLMDLVPFARYWWRVDGGGASAEGTFVTGIEKWRMPFFRPGWDHDPLEYWVARKRVELHGAKSVILSLATLGSHRLYVNGKAASEGFGPNRSHIEDGILLATTYEITPLVMDGENEILIYVNDNWAGTRLCKEKRSCLSVDGCAVTEKGVVAIDSSEPWTVAKSRDRSYGPIGANCNGRSRGIERLCDMEEFTDTQDGVLREGPAFNVICDVSDRDWCIRELRPVSIVQDGDAWKIDMGEEFTGFMRLKLKGQVGTTARMTVSDTFVDRCTFGQISEFRFCGGGGVFENRLNWQAGRFLYLTGCERPKADDMTGIVLSSVGRRDGDFRGDHDLETIRDLDNNTMTATTQLGVTVDCPHRERLGYGEASLSAMWGNMSFFDSAAYFYAYILKWASSQEPSGRIPHTSPDGYGWGGTFWSCFPVYSLWEFSRFYPDNRLFATMRPVVDKWLDYLHSHVKDGILEQYEPKRGDCLGDWLYPEIHFTKGTSGDWGHTVEGMFFNNCSYAWAILRALEIDGLVTDPARREELKRRHAALVAAIDHEWYKNGIYVSEDARYQSIAILSGAAEAGGHAAATEKAMLDIVERKGYVDGGSPSYTVILRALCQSTCGRELVLRTFRRHKAPGFLYFADEGYNTIPEDWWYGHDSRGSMIHTCYTGPAGALMHGFAGFEVKGNEITVAPFLSDALPNFSAHTETLYGTLAVKVEARGDRRIVWVTFPNGCQGRLAANGDIPLRPGLNRFELNR